MVDANAAKNDDGNTALIMAIERSHLGVISELAKH